MSLPVVSVSVVKMTRKAPHSVDVKLVAASTAEPLAFQPQLALGLLADAPGSPLADKVLDEAAAKAIGTPAILKGGNHDATWRIPVHDAALAGVLKKGLTWESRRFAVAKPRVLAGAWTPDGKAVLVALDSGLARLHGVAKKGIGRVKARLNHPGLVAVGCMADALMTAGGREVRLWDAKGKKLTATHTLPADITAACIFGAEVVVGLQDGSVRSVSGTVFGAAGPSPVTTLASNSLLAAGFADGHTVVWSADGTEQGRTTGKSAITALSFDNDGGLLVGRADGSRTIHGKTERFERVNGVSFSTSALSPGCDELLLVWGSRVVAVSMDGAVATLAALETVRAVGYSPSGSIRVAFTENPSRLYLWDRQGTLLRMISGLPLSTLGAHFRRYVMTAFSPSEKLVAIHRKEKRYKNGAIVVCEVHGGGSVVLPNRNADYSWSEGAAWLDEDRLLVSYANEKDLLWTVSTQQSTVFNDNNFGSQVHRIARGIAICAPYSFSPDEFFVRSAEDLSPIIEYPLDGQFGSSYPPTMQISDDGATALLTNPFQTVVIMREGKPVWRIEGTSNDFDQAFLSPCGKWLLLRRKKRALEIWDVEAQRVRATINEDLYLYEMGWADGGMRWVTYHNIEQVTLDGERTVLVKGKDISWAAAGVSSIGALADGGVLCTSGSRQYRLLKRGYMRHHGRGCIAPDGKRVLVLSDHEAMAPPAVEL